MTKTRVLIVDDHPLICDSYIKGLKEVFEARPDQDLHTEMVHDCDAAKEKILKSNGSPYALVFLDMRLPASKDHRYLSGEDLGELIRQRMPEAKIIVATTFNDNYRMQNIVKSINPEGFLIKNDLDTDELVLAISNVLDEKPYFSRTVSVLLRRHMIHDLNVDKIDRQILYELSLGTRTKDLPEVVPLSIAGVEKRKRLLKEKFDVEEQGDKALIIKAREMGFI